MMNKDHNRLKLALLPQPQAVYVKEGYCRDSQKLIYMDDETNAESYQIEINKDKILISSATAAGRYYAQQTLAQVKRQFGNELPCMKIEDKPQFAWRGIHLDVSRHFFSVQTIKKLLSAMAHYKLNRFHWHLNDDQGWRIPISRYPRLTEKAAWRKEDNDTIYGGYYSKEEIKEVIEFARQHFIEVIPEIEIPGHARAALSAYPELSCRQKPLAVPSSWGIFEDVYCPGNDTTLNFLEEVLDEVSDMFPSPWIHIGGDECPTSRWQQCPLCQKRLKEENLATERSLQDWLINKMSTFLKSKGKISIGWDEIISDSLDDEVVVMIWRGNGKDAQKQAVKAKRKMILSPNFYCYFDWKQSSETDEKGNFGITPLSKTYNYDPLGELLGNKNLIMGIQGNIWTERICSEEDLFYMAFPRALAIAESGWSSTKSVFSEFKERVISQYSYLNELGISPCPVIE